MAGTVQFTVTFGFSNLLVSWLHKQVMLAYLILAHLGGGQLQGAGQGHEGGWLVGQQIIMNLACFSAACSAHSCPGRTPPLSNPPPPQKGSNWVVRCASTRPFAERFKLQNLSIHFTAHIPAINPLLIATSPPPLQKIKYAVNCTSTGSAEHAESGS